MENKNATEPPSAPSLVVIRRLVPVLIWAMALVLILKFFGAAEIILLGVLAAAAVASLLQPLADKLPGSRASGAVVAGVGFALVTAALFAGMGWLLSAPISEELSRLPELRLQTDRALEQWSTRLKISPPLESSDVLKQVAGIIGEPGTFVAGAGQVLITVGVALVFVFIGSIFMLAEPRDQLLGPALRAFSPRRRGQLLAAMDELGPKLRWWLIGHLSAILIVGVVSGIGYSIAGINFALPLAVLAGMAELAPTVGAFAAGIVAVLVASTQGSGPVIGAVITWAVVQAAEGYVIIPLIMKGAVRLPAVVTLFTVVLWGEVFGIAGLFLAIPLDLAIWTFFKHLVIEDREQSGETRKIVLPEQAAAPILVDGS